ncbi:MauE/DoxX family redox-associated membrane protein [Sinomicrobium soli]|uniref:MauE/DoxX family redox-associated membrane protein n=1 Tax=Sinomicrobium sp. N-1-3-6 TaxID=2219864 RepID=UPI00191C1AEC|nr:MauE/DoxX family redox-associated membrane protein [Sinomicrobium sp. N-1-3-6]
MKNAVLTLPRFVLRKRNIILETICYLFIFLFLYAAFSKLMDVQKFQVQMSKSPLITQFAGLLAWGVPILEIIVAIFLFVPRLRLTGLYASFSLMLAFTGYIFIIQNFSPYVPCSCGGILSSMGWTEHFFFNIGFTLLAVFGIFLYNREQSHAHSYALA